MNSKKKCFVIIPFSETDSLTEKKWTEIFEDTIKRAVEESGLGYECKRYGLGRANIVKDIVEDLNRANVVIADLTDNNTNVLWELGVRHTLRKGTILIAQNKKFLPSDLKDYPVIIYKYKQTPAQVVKFKREIKDKLKDIEAHPDKADSPVADFLKDTNIALLSTEKSANLRRITALISEVSRNIEKVAPILSIVRDNQKLRKKGKKGTYISANRFETACLELLVSSNYITLPKNLLGGVVQLHDDLSKQNVALEVWQNETYEKAVEKRLIATLPSIKKALVSLLVDINKLRLDYINDNYLEPIEPCIVLASPEHKKYLKLTE